MRQAAYVSYWTTAGKRVRTSRGVNSKKTYEGRLQACLELKASIIDNFQPVLSVEEKAWAWIESRKPHLRKKSYYGYQSKLRMFLAFKGDRPMSVRVVDEYFDHRRGRVAGGTLADDKIYLARVFGGVTNVDYFSHLELPRYVAETKKHYQRHHISIIRDHLLTHDPDLWFACQCVYYLFLRPGSELRLLKVHHFDLDEMRVHVPPHVSKTGRNEYIRIPKQFQQAVMSQLGHRSPTEWLFPGVFDDTKPIGGNTMMTRYRKHMLQLGYPHYTMYGWKNTGGIDLARKNISPKKLQIQMRHSSLEMTDRYLRRMGFNDLTDEDLDFTPI